MKQSKLKSLLEAKTNTIIGFTVSYILAYTILPFYGVEQSHATSLEITLIYTAVSIIRNYTVRRYFNKR